MLALVEHNKCCMLLVMWSLMVPGPIRRHSQPRWGWSTTSGTYQERFFFVVTQMIANSNQRLNSECLKDLGSGKWWKWWNKWLLKVAAKHGPTVAVEQELWLHRNSVCQLIRPQFDTCKYVYSTVLYITAIFSKIICVYIYIYTYIEKI